MGNEDYDREPVVADELSAGDALLSKPGIALPSAATKATP